MSHMIDIFGTEIEAEYDKATNTIMLRCHLGDTVPTPDSTGAIYAHLTEGVQHKYFELRDEVEKVVEAVKKATEKPTTSAVETTPASITKAKPAATLEGE